MIRAPYPARIAAGLIMTAIEETRKLPTLIVTLPMTAVSQTLQAGMRAQQNIAELAIKGDTALEMLFDRSEEQPEWARFDEDEEIDTPDPAEEIAPAVPITSRTAATKSEARSTAKSESKPESTTPEATTKAAAAKSATEKAPAAKKATTKKAAAKKAAPAETVADDSDSAASAPRADAGRFALYSDAPADLIESDNGGSVTVTTGDAPEIVEYLEYDGLTLAQLRAKLRSVDVDDLAVLVDYERGHRNRQPFVTMLENRIASQTKRQSTT